MVHNLNFFIGFLVGYYICHIVVLVFLGLLSKKDEGDDNWVCFIIIFWIFLAFTLVYDVFYLVYLFAGSTFSKILAVVIIIKTVFFFLKALYFYKSRK